MHRDLITLCECGLWLGMMGKLGSLGKYVFGVCPSVGCEEEEEEVCESREESKEELCRMVLESEAECHKRSIPKEDEETKVPVQKRGFPFKAAF